MKKKITFFVFSSSSTVVRQATFSKTFLLIIGFLTTFITGVLGYGIYDYHGLRMVLFENNKLNAIVSSQLNEIKDQHKQIQKFATKINTLKVKLVQLDRFEEKIRTFANLNDGENNGGLFGIGGPMTENIELTLKPQESHKGLIREMHVQVEELNIASTKQQNEFKDLLGALEDRRNLLDATPSIKPAKIGYYSSKFGRRKSPFTHKIELHSGLDIAAPKGTPVLATADGIISYTGEKKYMGSMVTIDHGYGIVTCYGHLSKIIKKCNDKVKKGDTIALMGSSGRSTGPHVHYEVRLNGIPVNPKKYIY